MPRKLLCLMMVVLFILTACENDNQPPMDQESSTGEHVVNWVLINNPPNVEGPCYAFFLTKGSSGGKGTFSGVYCVPSEHLN